MKKLLLLCLVLLGGVMQVSATNNVTIYFQPNNSWKDANAWFAAALYDSNNTQKGWVKFEKDDAHDCYYANIDTDNTPNFIFVRKGPTDTSLSWDNKWGQTPSTGWGTFPTKETYMYLTGTDVDGAAWNTSYLPWCYYFYGNFEGGENWSIGDQLTKEGNLHTGTLVGKADKHFVIFAGSEINYWSGYIWNNDTWNNAIRPSESKTINFEACSNVSTTSGKGLSQNWYINSTNEGKVQIAYNSSDNNYSISCTKSATIGPAGYITYSNTEKCTISGATAYKASANNTSTVTLTAMDPATVWPEKEGMILKGSENDVVTINSVASGATATTIGTNYLVGSGNSDLDITEPANKYVFSWDGSDHSTVGFYKAASGNGTLGAHKAYLDLTEAPNHANEFFGFDFGETTGIANLNVNDNVNFNADAPMYNLAGQRVGKNYKGVVIQNGKKMLMK